MKNKKPLYLAICAACGAALALSFDLGAGGVIAWFLPVPAFYIFLCTNQTKKNLARCCAVFCAALSLVYYAAIFDLDLSARTGAALLYEALGWLLLSVLHGGMLFLALYFAFSLHCPTWARPLVAGTLWVAAEWLMGTGALGLPCLRLGVTQWALPALAQGASLFGALFVSLLMVVFAALAATAMHAFSRAGRTSVPKKRGAALAALAAGLFLTNLIAGTFAVSTPQPSGNTARVAAVQINAPSRAGQDEDAQREKAIDMAQQAARYNPDIILLPENAFWGSMQNDAQLAAACEDLATQADAYVLSGAYGVFGFAVQNSLFLFAPDGSLQDAYHKQQLVPLFENGYIRPFTFEVGTERGIFETEYGSIGVMICFESMFPGIAAQTVREGAQLLTIATNDSWFSGQAPKTRHFAHTVLRAIETRRMAVQVSNDGMTGAITARGQVMETLSVHEDGILTIQAVFSDEVSLYMLVGDWWILVLLAGCACLVLYSYVREKRHGK